MYKVVIIDDEKAVINGISKSINWSEMNLDLVGSAEDGDDGLELIYKVMPDIVITDIKMPTLTGIEMCRVLNNSNLFPEIILISAYDDHKFARDAISLGAFDYLLKPFKPSDLVQVLKKCIKKLDAYSVYKKSFDYNNRQNLLKSVLTNKIDLANNHDLVSQINAVYDLPLPSYFAVVSIQLDSAIEEGVPLDFNEVVSFIRLYYKNKQSSQVKSIIIDIENKNRVAVFYTFSTISNITFVLETDAKALQMKVMEIFSCKPYVGMSGYSESIADLSSLYIKSIKAVHLCQFNREVDLIFYDDIIKHKKLFDYSSFYKNLPYIIENSNKEKFGLIIDEMFLSYITTESDVFTHLKLICLKICHYFELNALKNSDNNKISIIDETAKRILKTPHFMDIYNEILSFSSLLSKKDNLEEVDAAIQKALQYIDGNLSEPITLAHVAEHVHLSNSFFSIKFSTIMGMPFSKYLANKRIETAKMLFQQNKGLKVYEVGVMVGYTDARYFGTLFKKIVGVTPHQYAVNLQ